jgi:hypothetical protein
MEKARRELLYWRSSDDWVALLHVSLQHNPERLSGTTRGVNEYRPSYLPCHARQRPGI